MAEEKMKLDSVLENGRMFFDNAYPEKNLYFLLYTNFNDDNIYHFENLLCHTRVDDWTYEEAIQHCASFIDETCEHGNISTKEFFEKYDFPAEMQSAVQDVKKQFGIKETLKENQLKEMAELIGESITIRTYEDGSSHDETRPATQAEAELISKVAYSALWTVNYHLRSVQNSGGNIRDLQQYCRDQAEMMIDSLIPGCNGYDTMYNPLGEAFEQWEQFVQNNRPSPGKEGKTRKHEEMEL